MRSSVTIIESQSKSLVQELARISNHSQEEVRGVYDNEFRQLELDARVRTFLPILAARRARKVLSTR